MRDWLGRDAAHQWSRAGDRSNAVERCDVEDRTARMQKRFEWPVTVAAVLVIPSMALTRSEHGSVSWWIGAALNVVIWLVFAAELAAILYVTPRRWQ